MSANENQLQIEVLQPEISGEIQKTTSVELKNWIMDGKLKPNHQVRIKNLSWMEAHKIPAFQALFESVKNKEENEPIHFKNNPLSNTSAPKLIESKFDEAATASKKTFSFTDKISFKNGTDNSKQKNKPKTAEPSIAYKLFEEKATGKSQKNESKPKHSRISSDKQNKFLAVKKTAGFLAGCILMCLLAFGGSYFWVYQLKTPPQMDEKAIPELSSLENKLTSDKLELRLKKAEKEKELIAASDQSQPIQQIDLPKEFAKLENQFNNARKTIIKNRADKLQNDDFYTTFYFSFAVLLCLFLLLKVFYGRTTEPVAVQNKSELPDVQVADDLDFTAEVDEKIEFEDYQNTDSINSAEVHITKSSEENLLKTSNLLKTTAKIVTIVETPQVSEFSEAVKIQKSGICLLHLSKPSDFVCGGCQNHFCAECTVSVEDDENCCPFCKFVCLPLAVESDEATPLKSEAEEKKKPNLLELGENTDYSVRNFPERTKKIGVVMAFLISLLFSISISIFWVYKISPYLENRGKETSQNAANVNGQTSENSANKTVEADQSKAAANNNTANEPCIDPQTRQPFECDEETRRALEDHTKKVKSVEKAQADTAEKTDKILSLVLPSSSPATENANQESPNPNPADVARKEFEKQQLIKVFTVSFLTIFGLLMLTRLFSKDKKTEEED